MPSAFLLCGPSLAGKTQVARTLAAAFGAVVISADEINAERGLPFGAEGLPESVWAETLRLQLERARHHGHAGRPIVVDDTLCYRWLRDRHAAACREAGLEPRLLLLAPPPAVLWQRHAAAAADGSRPVLSADRLADHLARFEWPAADEGALDVTDPGALAAITAAAPLGR